MKDIMLFGAGHEGTKKQVEPGKESYYFNSMPVPSPTGANIVSHRSCYQRCKTDPPQRLKIDPGVNLLL
ncbi:hypothetical protein VZ114_17360 [Enterobacter hormaechei]|uniref:hypothetical protein n=1 Tax=Enterobacter hormaechei TaxID=158836 RepID=UPI002E2E4E75|nr:hypothetical protein [Enterobacter hormaechei]MED5634896.1 hypothetical protein [Enterobacter hormaechei]